MPEYRNPFQEILSGIPDDEGQGITLTRGQLNAWAGRDLTDEEVETLEEAIPNSSIPEAIQLMADSLTHEEEEDLRAGLPLILAMDDDYCPTSKDNRHKFAEDRTCDLCGASEEEP